MHSEIAGARDERIKACNCNDHAQTSLKADGRLVINRIILLKVQCRPRLAKALESVIQFAMVLSLETTFDTKNKPPRGGVGYSTQNR